MDATRATADAAAEIGAAYVLLSTDRVFDGTRGGAVGRVSLLERLRHEYLARS